MSKRSYKRSLNLQVNLIQASIIVILILICSQTALASNGGIPDSDRNMTDDMSTDSTSCGMQCHNKSTHDSVISITVNPGGPYNTSQSGIWVNVTVYFYGSPSVNSSIGKGGAMLLNNDALNINIKNDGWIITQDPDNNTTPYNWNMCTITRSILGGPIDWGYYYFNWTLTAPSTPGTYYLNAHGRWGDNSTPDNQTPGAPKEAYQITTNTPLTMIVQQPVPEFPLGAAAAFLTAALIFAVLRNRMQ